MDITWKYRTNFLGEAELTSFSVNDHAEIKQVIEEFKIPSVVEGRKIDAISDTIHLSFRELKKRGTMQIKRVIVEDGIKNVDSWAFSNIFIKIDEFYWPATCDTIPVSCFSSSAIREIKGIDHVKQIGHNAFNATALVKIKWPSQCLDIPERCFISSALREIDGTENVTKIEKSAFELTNIEKFTWPAACTAIPERCFLCCHILKSIDGINKINSIGERAFSQTCIDRMVWPETCKRIPSKCFEYTFIKEISNIDHVISIGRSAFERTLITKFIWPPKCKVIPTSCFSMTPLKEIQGIEKVEKIGTKAFEGTLLQTFIWPSKINAIDCFFLDNCIPLKKIIFAENSGILEVNLNFLSSLNKVEVIDLSKVAVVNFINTNSEVETSILFEKIKDKLRLPYYVAGI